MGDTPDEPAGEGGDSVEAPSGEAVHAEPVAYACEEVRWITAQSYCGDNVDLMCKITGNPPDEPARVEVLHPTSANVVATINTNMTAGEIRATWVAKAQTANWRTDRIRFQVKAAGLTCVSNNEFSFRQRPTTAWELINQGHNSGNGFADVGEHHDAQLETNRVHYSLKLRTDGDPFNDAKKLAAKTLIQNVWNNGFSTKKFHRTGCQRGDACDCTFDCCKADFRLDVNFVDAGEHVLIHIHVTVPPAAAFGSSQGQNEGDWGDPPRNANSTYPHEVGHLLGQYDEYSTGAIDPGYVATDPNTQPPDAGALGESNLMSTSGNQTLLNRHYRRALHFLNNNTDGDVYKII